MGLGTACLIAAGIVWLRQPSAPHPSASGVTASPAELALNVNLPTVAQVDQWTKTLDAPLEEETKLVLIDAKAALVTLSSSFLPETLLTSSPETARP